MFVEQTHEVRHEWRDNERPMRFTDTRLDEQERAISLKMVPMSLVMEGSSGKSYLMNLIDTPGKSISNSSFISPSWQHVLWLSGKTSFCVNDVQNGNV